MTRQWCRLAKEENSRFAETSSGPGIARRTDDAFCRDCDSRLVFFDKKFRTLPFAIKPRRRF